MSQQKKKNARSSARRLAEWVSLGISASLLLGIAVYLVRQALANEGPHVVCQAEVRVNEAHQQEGGFIVPLKVSNPSERSLRLLRITVEYEDPTEGQMEREIDVEYLSERSHQTLYLYFRHDPRQFQITATPSYYQLK